MHISVGSILEAAYWSLSKARALIYVDVDRFKGLSMIVKYISVDLRGRNDKEFGVQ